MKDAVIILSAMVLGVGLIFVVIAILPYLIAVACIVFIYLIIAKLLVGGFSFWQRNWQDDVEE